MNSIKKRFANNSFYIIEMYHNAQIVTLIDKYL